MGRGAEFLIEAPQPQIVVRSGKVDALEAALQCKPGDFAHQRAANAAASG
jgi:hypothetical protein